MNANQMGLNRQQLIFLELLVGTLIYVVVLGLFEEYTDLVSATSFSNIVLASVVLEGLTFLTFLFKDRLIRILTQLRGELSRPQELVGLWLVMFFSKFVFVWGIDFIFRDDFEVRGFFAILIVVTCVTVLAKLGNAFFMRLGAPADVLN